MTTTIRGTDNSAAAPALTGNDSDTGVYFPAADTIALSAGGAEKFRAGATEVVVNDTGANLDFRVEGDTEPNLLFVDASADAVGIGTSSPSFPLDVVSNASSNALQLRGRSSDNTSRFELRSNDAATHYGTIFAYNNVLGIEAAQASGNILFNTNSAERMRITSAGLVGIGNSSPSRPLVLESSAFASAISVVHNTRNISGDQTFLTILGSNCNNTSSYHYIASTGGGDKLYIFGNGNIVNTNNSYGPLSDVKLKKDIVDAGSQWDDLKAIRIRKFRFKNDPDGVLQIGVIAQELEEVSPGLVSEHPDHEMVEVPILDDEGNPVLDEENNPTTRQEHQATGETTKSVKATVLYMKAVKALQEAMERIETLEAKVAALEAK